MLKSENSICLQTSNLIASLCKNETVKLDWPIGWPGLHVLCINLIKLAKKNRFFKRLLIISHKPNYISLLENDWTTSVIL